MFCVISTCNAIIPQKNCENKGFRISWPPYISGRFFVTDALNCQSCESCVVPTSLILCNAEQKDRGLCGRRNYLTLLLYIRRQEIITSLLLSEYLALKQIHVVVQGFFRDLGFFQQCLE